MIEQSSRVVPGGADSQGLQVLESCSFTWIFEPATRRFRRVPRDVSVSPEVPAPWTEYHHLEIDDPRSRFRVQLNEDASRSLRAWLHADPCPRCGPTNGPDPERSDG